MCIALKLGFSSTHRRAVSIPKFGQTPHSHTQVASDKVASDKVASDKVASGQSSLGTFT